MTALLIEGHNGIYEVSLGRSVLYSNQGRCTGFPTVEEILWELGRYKNPLPGIKLKKTEVFPIHGAKK